MGKDAEPPAFVLTVARSGSTLLRFILDSHPDMACPPETNVAQSCFGLARLWDLLEPSQESERDGWRPDAVPVQLPPVAARSIRAAVDEVYGRYLARRGKRRWCDKSLDSARLAELLAHLYPDSQFICLYRHCMDAVISAIDAAPWGLGGYGLDQYVAGTPGNMVLAAARCWLDQTTAIIEFQEKHPDRCHGVRYEDLVTSPEQITADLFAFLDLAMVPGITQTCLSQEHDTRGPGDHKIWYTSQISATSLGQGARVPVQMLPPEFLKSLNETLGQLNYRQVDEDWKVAPGPADPRMDSGTYAAPAVAALDNATAGAIGARLESVSEETLRDLARQWPVANGKNLMIAVQTADGAGLRHCWTISCADSAVIVRQGEIRSELRTTLLAPSATWQALLEGQANFAAELRAGRLRCLEHSADPGTTEKVNLRAELHLIAYLLGLAPRSPRLASTGPSSIATC